MIDDDGQEDRFLASVASLQTYDVSQHHSRQLRRRCHSLLKMATLPKRSIGVVIGTSFQRVLAPAIGVAWCLAYLVEIIRRTAAVYNVRL